MNKELSIFKKSILNAYSKESELPERHPSDLSPLELWLIKRLYDSETERNKLWKKLWKE